MDLRERTADLVEDRPGIEDDLRELLEVDEGGDPWEFGDLSMDSGEFGEVVSRGIVEEDGDGYRVADREAVRAALDGEPAPGEADGSGRESSFDLDAGALVPEIDRRSALALAGALAVLIAMRLVAYPAVFRNGDVVLYPNDPYYYRYWVDQVTAQASGPFDPGIVGDLPGGITKGEPLLVAVLGWFAELLGGGTGASGTVLAWYPLVAGAISGVLVYLLGKEVTDDPRVGVAAVLMLAVTPIHTIRTAVGVADHHAFDLIWLGITAVALVILAEPERRESRVKWIAAGALGVGVAGQILSWDASPLLLLPIAAIAVFRTLSDVRTDRSPLAWGKPVVAGLAFGAAITALAHYALGWHTTVVTFAPALLAVGVAGVTLVATVARRRKLSVRSLAGIYAAGALLGGVLFPVVLPSFASKFTSRFVATVSNSGIVETRSLVSGKLGFVVGPLFHFGLVLLIAVPYLVWATRRVYRNHRPKWLVLVTYTWYFLVIAVIQVRFASQLSLFAAVFAGLAIVHVAAWIDVAREPGPFRESRGDRQAFTDGGWDPSIGWPGARLVVALAIIWFIVSVPGIAMSVNYVNDSTIGDARYGAASEARDYVRAHDLSRDGSYVLSRWSYNRLYNYFANGNSRSYRYARQRFPNFLKAKDPEKWYRTHSGRVGFAIVERGNYDLPPGRLYSRLTNGYGSRTAKAAGLAHYRAIYESDDGNVLAYRLVPGATITGSAPANATLTVRTNVEVDGASFAYERRVRTGPNGNFSVTVPYPGTYAVGNRTVVVPEKAPESGAKVPVDDPD